MPPEISGHSSYLLYGNTQVFFNNSQLFFEKNFKGLLNDLSNTDFFLGIAARQHDFLRLQWNTS
jgi:hypothetical protein